MEGVNELNTLDFNKIKRDLSTGKNRDKGFLLQALRWVSLSLLLYYISVFLQ